MLRSAARSDGGSVLFEVLGLSRKKVYPVPLPPTNMEVQKGPEESSLSTGVCVLPCLLVGGYFGGSPFACFVWFEGKSKKRQDDTALECTLLEPMIL